MLSIVSVVVFVVLGCHIQEIQQNRLSSALAYANTHRQETILSNVTVVEPYWFLTGGVKNALVDHVGETEAHKMKRDLVTVNIKNIVLDTSAKNTAENFVNLKQWINKFDSTHNINVVITTSAFHQKRAQKIFEGVFYDKKIEPEWNLGFTSCQHCESDEHIHILNVDNDVKKALASI